MDIRLNFRMWFKYGLKGRAACGFLMALEASVPQGVWVRYFAASLLGDKLSAQALADAVMAIPDLEAAALQLADRSERRYGGVQKAFAAAGKSALLWEEISVLTTWLSL